MVEEELGLERSVDSVDSVPLPGRVPSPFIGVLDLFPQICWREGLPHGDAGKGGCTVKVESMDVVHGRSGVT